MLDVQSVVLYFSMYSNGLDVHSGVLYFPMYSSGLDVYSFMYSEAFYNNVVCVPDPGEDWIRCWNNFDDSLL